MYIYLLSVYIIICHVRSVRALFRGSTYSALTYTLAKIVHNIIYPRVYNHRSLDALVLTKRVLDNTGLHCRSGRKYSGCSGHGQTSIWAHWYTLAQPPSGTVVFFCTPQDSKQTYYINIIQEHACI